METNEIGGFIMWLDNASKVDMLFYRPYAKLILKTIRNKNLNPLTIGLFGSWGAGKSTLLKMIEDGINEEQEKVVCINLNAWMFEGYEDAKSALMESLLRQIELKKTKFGEITEKLSSLMKRVNFFKLGSDALSKGLPILAGVLSGNPLPIALSFTGSLADILQKAPEAISGLNDFKDKYIQAEESKKESIIQNIRLFREEFSDLLNKSEIDNLVVIIDDLDRCTPERIIDTLEAIKLFLSVEKTTFILAVDERVIEYSVKRKYPLVDDKSMDISTDYIEKIIQLQISIPELSSKDIENYIIILILQLYLKKNIFEELLNKIYTNKYMLQDRSMTIEQINGLINYSMDIFNEGFTNDMFIADMSTINSIKDIVSSSLKGNPRQAKRFLNNFIAKKTLSQMYFEDEINIQILAKLLALQTIDIDAFRELNEWNKQFDGEIKQLKVISECTEKDLDTLPSQYSRWSTPRMLKWIACEPKELYKENLSKYFYLSRDVLSKNNDLTNDLTSDEKSMLQELINSSEGTIDAIITKLVTKSPDSYDKIIKIIVKKFEAGDVKLSTIRRLFCNFRSHRGILLEAIEKMNKSALGMASIPHLIAIWNEDKSLVQPIFERMKDKNMPSATFEAIVNKKSKKSEGK